MTDIGRTSKSFDVLGTGAVSVDDFLYVEHYPRANQKVRVLHREQQCGGQTGTALVTVARLGRRAGYVGILGRDELSQTVSNCFRREKVALDHCVRRPEATVCHATIIVDRATNSRTILAHIDGHVGPAPKLPGEDVIRSTAVLLVDHHGLEGTLRAARIARAAGIPVVGDIERTVPLPTTHGRRRQPEHVTLAEVLPFIDHLVVPLRFAQEWTGLDDAADAAMQLWVEAAGTETPRAAVVVTCGEAGCWYLDRKIVASDKPRPVHCPSFEVEVADTTGCGDVFHGAYCVALAEGMGLSERVRFASAAAALKATRQGGQAGIPTRKHLNAFLVERES